MKSIKLSDWKALDQIQRTIELYRSGEQTDSETIEAIVDILHDFGFLDE